MMGLVEERLIFGLCLEVRGLASPISYILVEHGRLFQNGDPFRHHHCVGNRLPSCMQKFAPIFKLFDKSGKEICGVISPNHFHRIFFQVNFVYRPIACE